MFQKVLIFSKKATGILRPVASKIKFKIELI